MNNNNNNTAIDNFNMVQYIQNINEYISNLIISEVCAKSAQASQSNDIKSQKEANLFHRITNELIDDLKKKCHEETLKYFEPEETRVTDIVNDNKEFDLTDFNIRCYSITYTLHYDTESIIQTVEYWATNEKEAIVFMINDLEKETNYSLSNIVFKINN